MHYHGNRPRKLEFRSRPRSVRSDSSFGGDAALVGDDGIDPLGALFAGGDPVRGDLASDGPLKFSQILVGAQLAGIDRLVMGAVLLAFLGVACE